MKDGLYFGLEEQAYHKDEALGSGDVRLLLRSPPDWWWHSHMNPLRPADKETPAKLYGRALHKLVLEGPEAFKASFCKEPDKRDYPTALITVAHLETFLTNKGLDVPSRAKKADLEKVARQVGGLLWSDVVAEHEGTNRTPIKPEMHDEIVMAGAQIARNEKLREAFRNGRSEVSVFWTQAGVRCKARFDFLKTKQIVDLKSFRNSLGNAPVDRIVANAIAQFRLDVQAAHYLRGRAAAARFIEDDQFSLLTGPGISADWLRTVAAESDFEHWLVFYQAEGAPVVLLRRFKPASQVIQMATMDVDRALQTFRDNLARYGEEPWGYTDPLLDPDVDFDMLPQWMSTGVV